MNSGTDDVPRDENALEENEFELDASSHRRRWLLPALAAALALAIAAYSYFSSGEGDQPASDTSRPSLTVTTAVPERQTWPVTLSASGVIAPWQEASIGTQIGSYQLVEVRVNVGDHVRRGQVLARLNPALLQAEEAQLLASHQQAVANDQRARGLKEVGGISEQEALAYETEVRTTRAMLEAKRLELRYTSIRAPDHGVISARTATLGAVVPPGEELFRMIRQNRLEWRGEFTAEQLGSIVRGQAIDLELPDGGSASATVRQIAPSMDAQSRLAIVFADISPGNRAQSGMYVTGIVSTGEAAALAVPAECIILRDGRNYVALVSGGDAETAHHITLREVRTGRRQGGRIEILTGLAGNERLARRGAAFLNDGDVVQLVSEGAGRP
ncbi:efflux RND transporter periplasmic adaptor subunit [Alteraurantiacibacter aquimixticola]|uniref:Efflux RND transporter periplasmic adaptor subunit n=1 Tax=Alteraurantiacibacter aquimixticola TaxID=2489173 RepID=A0A4T3F9H4_9SPHN|nr:efflux RND transporter periplasmic adaptor subunit [Alteraurantiacibacter aquimixticola]TIX51670.1 efflux RND transporter periplasmic adaptor subunit [Alteraurantiacibacter aquimixticola]